LVQTVKAFPGYRGITAVVPGGADRDFRIVMLRFADKASMGNWEASPERKRLREEVENYATQVFNKATGLETWFELPNTHAIVPPPKWKMAVVTFLAASVVSYLTRLILGPYLSGWPMVTTTPLYVAILILALTYFVMPNLSKLLRRWLYPAP
jgi:uncharacterized protein